MASILRVLTLNCWALPFPTAGQQKYKRIEAIGREIGKGEYDIVVLEEVWLLEDYNKLTELILPEMKYTHYYHSGVIGSGICIFSKHPILETLQHRYSLNGYAHKLHHFDWYGAKMVGLCKILIDNEIRVNVYSTHLHAFYHHPNDEYKAHRTVQAFEMSQFIKHTSETCDIVIVAGDLNTRPDEIGLSVLTSNGNLDDAWTNQKEKPMESDIGATCDCPDNPFRGLSLDADFPKGYRLDYLLYRSNSGYNMDCEKCYITMGKIPGEDINYSDHEGLAAEFKIKKNITAMGRQIDAAAIEKTLLDCLPAIDEGLHAVSANRYFYMAILILSLASLAYLTTIQASSLMYIFVNMLYVGLLCLILFAGWNGVVMIILERNTLLAAKKDVNNLLRSNY